MRYSEHYPAEHAMMCAINMAAGGRAFFGSNFIDFKGKHAHCTGGGYLLLHDANYAETRELHSIEEALEAFGLTAVKP